jgi:hypothetical protein
MALTAVNFAFMPPVGAGPGEWSRGSAIVGDVRRWEVFGFKKGRGPVSGLADWE